MNEGKNGIFTVAANSMEQATDLLNRLMSTARTESVYSQPIEKDGATVITASEVTIGMGVGFGYGGGEMPQEIEEGNGPGYGSGGGGGGGGYAGARPVAVIIIRDGKVTVEPVVDPTKLGVAGITMMTTVFVMLARVLGALRKSS